MRPISRREFLATAAAAGACALIHSPASTAPAATSVPKERLNVLMIAVDDLRPELGCYGIRDIKTPNIDRLAQSGVLFERAYCQQALCSPSRTSLLTGLRPDTTGIYNLETHFRRTTPSAVTLPQYFKQNGYHSQGFSKIYHGGLDDPQSWSVPHWAPNLRNYAKPETLAAIEKRRQEMRAQGKRITGQVVERDTKTGTVLQVKRAAVQVKGPAWENPDVPDNALNDGATADRAIQALRQVKDKPFFMAVGFLKPHLPFVAPKKYFDLYSLADTRLAGNPQAPKDVPAIALHNWAELRGYMGIPKEGPLSDAQARELRRAYYAAASYTDAQIGKVIGELDRLGLRDRTVIVLWGDHGWQLGEHGLWCKHTNFETAARAPLIISAPGSRKGAKTQALAEFSDIYPTICELAGLPVPVAVEGRSLVPVMADPSKEVNTAAFSQYPRGKVMGRSIRTDRYRYTEWAEPGKKPEGVELYDHQTDPDENVNVASALQNKDVVARLSTMLKDGWKAAALAGAK